MPIYEYQCQSCQHVTEKMQKFSDPPLQICPHCGGVVEKLLSLTSFSLKGSGWYATDYKKTSSSAPQSNENKDTSKPNVVVPSEKSTSQTPVQTANPIKNNS